MCVYIYYITPYIYIYLCIYGYRQHIFRVNVAAQYYIHIPMTALQQTVLAIQGVRAQEA